MFVLVALALVHVQLCLYLLMVLPNVYIYSKNSNNYCTVQNSLLEILMCIVLTWCCEGGGFGARHRSYNSSGIASSRDGGVRELGSGSVSTGSCTTITISIYIYKNYKFILWDLLEKRGII